MGLEWVAGWDRRENDARLYVYVVTLLLLLLLVRLRYRPVRHQWDATRTRDDAFNIRQKRSTITHMSIHNIETPLYTKTKAKAKMSVNAIPSILIRTRHIMQHRTRGDNC